MMLLCPKTASRLHRSFSPLKPHIFRSSPRQAVSSLRFISKSFSAAATPLRSAAILPTRSFSAAAAAGDMAAVTTVDHVVLFKVREGTESGKINAMISNLQSLISLDGVLHLHSGPVLRPRSTAASSFGFTHLLHSRYRSKQDLAAYSADPAHVSVVREFVFPICEDIMAIDWIGAIESDPVPRPGSAARLTLMKLIESAGEPEKNLLLEAVRAAKELSNGVKQVSYGENFSPARAKGFSVGSVAIFPGIEELDELDGKKSDLIEAQKEKVRPLLESLIVLDFVVSPSIPATSGL